MLESSAWHLACAQQILVANVFHLLCGQMAGFHGQRWGCVYREVRFGRTSVTLCLSGSRTGEKDTPYILGIKGQAFPCISTFHWILVGKIGLDSFQYSEFH